MSITLPSGKFYGVVSERRELPEFTVTESVYPEHAHLPAHAHERPYFCVVLDGRYEETSAQRRHDCEPSDVIVHPAGEVHANFFHTSGGRCLNLEIGPGLATRLGRRFDVLNRPQEFRTGPMNWLARRLHQEFRRSDGAAPLAMEGLALEMVAEALRHDAGPDGERPRWLGQVCELLHARFSEPWTLAELAQWAEVHPVHLARSFRRHFHVTLGEYVRRLRVEFACRQLAEGDTSLAEIAVAAGFADQSHFTRIFKRVTGNTPARYRGPRSRRQSNTRR